VKARKSKAASRQPPAAGPRDSGSKQWGRRILAMVGAPLVFFGLLELGLRLCGFGYPTGFLLPWSGSERRLLVQNNQFGWRFFGPQMSRLPQAFALAREKEPGTIRIFVFGESAAFGDPQPRFGLPRMLEAILELRHPGVKFEVVNTALTGINSHVILPIARDCARADGDAWVVYMGNNEVVGPFGAGTVFGPQTPPLPLIRAGLALKTTRVGQALDAVRRKLHRAPPEKTEWGGMMMFLGQQIAASDPRMDRVYDNFQKNLADIVRAGKDSGAAVVVSTVASNLRDCAPFASVHRPDLSDVQTRQWEAGFGKGVEAQSAGHWPEAERQYRAAAQMDETYADLRFRLGQCALAQGRAEDARRELAAARDLDALRFRCDSRLNAILRQTAAGKDVNSGVLLADAEAVMAAASPDGLPGAELFYEHVHLTFAGNYVLARTIAGRVEELLARKLPASSRPWPEIADCARRLGWTNRARQLAYSEVLGRLTDPPFTMQSNHAEQQRHLAALAAQLAPADAPVSLREAQVACETALTNWPGDALLYQQLAEIKQAEADPAGTSAAATRSLELLPSNQECWLILGLALAQQQKFAEAAAACRRVFELDPEDVWGRQNLALSLQKMGRSEEAIREFKRALAIKPRFGLAWLGLGEIYEQMGRKDESAECFRLALANRIHRAQELTTLARFCERRGWFEAAATNYADAIALSPSDASLRLEAGQPLGQLGRHAEAARRYEEACRLSPDLGQAHFLLGLELGTLGKPADAAQEFQEAVRLLPEVMEARLNLGIALSRQGKSTAALEQFAEVLRHDGTNALALKYVAALRGGAAGQ
jgi:tetratricopeptide (TPR) repeat protein